MGIGGKLEDNGLAGAGLTLSGPSRYRLNSPLLRQFLPLQCLHLLGPHITAHPRSMPVFGLVRIHRSRRLSLTWCPPAIFGFEEIVIHVCPAAYAWGASSSADPCADGAKRLGWHTSTTFVPTVQTGWRFVLHGNMRHDCQTC